MKTIKLIFKLFLLAFDILAYKLFKKKNTKKSYSLLIELFCLTGGHSNTLINNLLKKKNNLTFDISGNKDEVEKLNNNGYIFKEKFFDKNIIDNINNKILTLNGKYDGDLINSSISEQLNISKPKATIFRYEQNDLINLPEIQNILTNKYILSIAEGYFKSLPIIDTFSAWWSFKVKNDDADHKAAQSWHFDMDRAKWLKIFIHLEDVKEDNGPHSFVSGTHKNHGIDKIILKQGYKRIENEIINCLYSKSKIIRFLGNKGSMLIEDTRGIHKGEPIRKGSRLLLQLQYSTAIFGSNINKIKLPTEKTNQFSNLQKLNPKIFENFY